jgi:cytochrome c-type biogenesis protein CcmH
MRRLQAILLSLALLMPAYSIVPAYAIVPGEGLADPDLERRARALSLELRCLVCQNQSIDDSEAELARDLRQLVRARLTAGQSDDEIRAAIVERYGEFVLFRPQFGPHTFLLWTTPLLILLLGGFWAYRILRFSPSKPPE